LFLPLEMSRGDRVETIDQMAPIRVRGDFAESSLQEVLFLTVERDRSALRDHDDGADLCGRQTGVLGDERPDAGRFRVADLFVRIGDASEQSRERCYVPRPSGRERRDGSSRNKPSF